MSDQVSIAAVCFAGLPYYADFMQQGTGMTARHVLKVQPDLSSLRILPYAPKTALVMGNALDQYTNQPSPYCTRGLLQRVLREAAEKHNTTFSVGAEIEFCLVDAKTNDPVDRSVFANSVTLNDQESFLEDLYDNLKQQYIPVELIHAESGPGQLEVVLEYSTDPIVMADNIVLCRETIRAVARNHGLKALFTPKYDLMAAGNGMHLHFSTRNATTKEPNFSCQHHQGMSSSSALTTTPGGAFVEGLLSHLPAVMGLTLPTVNSFRRIGPGCWTGSSVGWAVEDKECGVRVCSNLATLEWDHFELKLIDHTCNIYLALAGILYAGMHGIENQMVLRPPQGQDKAESISSSSSSSSPDYFPASVSEALDALEADDYLMVGLMGPDLSKGYLALRRHEVERASRMDFTEEVKEFLSRA